MKIEYCNPCTQQQSLQQSTRKIRAIKKNFLGINRQRRLLYTGVRSKINSSVMTPPLQKLLCNILIGLYWTQKLTNMLLYHNIKYWIYN